MSKVNEQKYKYYFLQDIKVLEAARLDAEVSQKGFLQRLFPSVKVAEGEKHFAWLKDNVFPLL